MYSILPSHSWPKLPSWVTGGLMYSTGSPSEMKQSLIGILTSFAKPSDSLTSGIVYSEGFDQPALPTGFQNFTHTCGGSLELPFTPSSRAGNKSFESGGTEAAGARSIGCGCCPFYVVKSGVQLSLNYYASKVS